MQIPDYDNCVKWFACIKKRKLYAVWLSLPILMFFIIGVQWKIISKKNNKITEIKNQITPIKELYPKLELSGAVAKLLDDYQKIQKEVETIRQKGKSHEFYPFAEGIKKTFLIKLKELNKKYPLDKLSFSITCFDSSVYNTKKAKEIKELLKTLSVKAKVLYGMGNLTENITISYDKSLTQEEAMEIVQPFTLLFSTVIKLYPSETESKDYSMLFFHINLAGKPLFMENGKVFYKND